MVLVTTAEVVEFNWWLVARFVYTFSASRGACASTPLLSLVIGCHASPEDFEVSRMTSRETLCAACGRSG